MRFGPENKDLSNHSEQLLCIWIWARQPSRPAGEQITLNLPKAATGLVNVQHIKR